MADQLQLRGGTTNEHSTFTGALREVTVDTDKDTLIVHDAATAGGHPLLREDGSNSALSLGTAGTPSIKFTGDTNTGIYSPGADQVAISTGGTGRLFVNASGRVGVGTSSSQGILHIATANTRGILLNNSTVGTTATDGYYLTNTTDGSFNIVNQETSSSLKFNSDSTTSFTVSGSERLRIDSSGRLLVGTSTARSSTGAIQVETAGTTDRSRFEAFTNINSSAGTHITLGKSRGTTAGSNTVVQSGDEIGALNFHGTDGATNLRSAQIKCVVDGTPGTNDMPGRLVFSTTADGASSPTERMRIDSSGRVGVGTTSPAKTFEVNGTAALKSGAPYLYLTQTSATGQSRIYFGDPDTELRGYTTYDHSDDSYRVATASNERLRIDSSGRVGVGTSSPTALLHVSGGDFEIDQNIMVRGSDTRGVFVRNGANTQWGCQLQGNGNAHFLGNVGVGTTSPSELLHLSGGAIRVDGTFAANATSAIGLDQLAASTSAIRAWGASGTVANLTFNTGSGAAGDTEKMRIDSSGRVGIGTSSPSALLTVSSGEARLDLNATNTSGRLWNIYSGGGGNVGAGAFAIAEGGATQRFLIIGGGSGEAMRIDASNRVGIGTTSPAQNLHVKTSSGFHDFESIGSTSMIRYYGTDAAVGQIQAGSSGSSFRIDTGGSERLRIDSSGRLLVGTSSSRSVDNEKILQIEGVTQESSSMSLTRNTNSGAPPNISFGKSRGSTLGSNTIVQSGDSLGTIVFCGADGSDTNSRAADITCQVDGTPGTNDMPGRLKFSTTADGESAPTERMRITNDGKLRIGMADFGADPSASNGGTQFKNQNTGHILTAATVTTGVNHHLFFNPNGNVGSIKTTGSATSFNTSSDYRLKENVVDIDDGIARLKQLQPRRFNFIADIDTIVDGFIAHEAQAVVPEAVTGTKDEVDENGDPVMQGIDQSKLVPLLTAALQEAIGEIESLKARVAALEAN